MKFRIQRIAMAFESIADYYDEYMDDTGHSHAQIKMVQLLRDELRGRVLDVATGTGIIANNVEAETVGIDISKEMIKIAKRGGREFLVADAEHLPFSDNSFDVVTCCLGMLWLDKPKVLREMGRVGKKVILIEEEGVPARARITPPEHLKPFFHWIEKLETSFTIEDAERILGSEAKKRGDINIDGSHRFIAWAINAGR